jgi:hypothetical protein
MTKHAAIDDYTDERQLAAMHALVRRLRPGAEVTVGTEQKARSLSVEGFETPGWYYGSRDDHEVVLSGYGTEYVITVYGDITDMPRLSWPSCRAAAVWELTIDKPAPETEQLSAKKTAGDLYWRVDRYGGR